MPLPRIAEVARLWADVELRYTAAGKAVATVPLVFSKRIKDRDTGEWRDAGSLFVKGSAWDELGEHAAETFSKGMEVLVVGELSQREYERNDGSKGTSLEMQVYSIGPNLKFATAKVQKVERSSGGGWQQQSSAPAGAVDDPWGASSESAPF